jgi:hypothetical protein
MHRPVSAVRDANAVDANARADAALGKKSNAADRKTRIGESEIP